MRSRSVLPWAFIAFAAVAIAFVAVAFRGTREMTKMSYRARSFG